MVMLANIFDTTTKLSFIAAFTVSSREDVREDNGGGDGMGAFNVLEHRQREVDKYGRVIMEDAQHLVDKRLQYDEDRGNKKFAHSERMERDII